MLFNTPKILHLKIIFSILFYAWHLQLFCARYFYVHFMYILCTYLIVSSRHSLIYFRINAVCIRHNILSVLFERKDNVRNHSKFELTIWKFWFSFLFLSLQFLKLKVISAFSVNQRLLAIIFTKCKCF